MLLYLALIVSYLRHRMFHPDLLLVGAECQVRWSWEKESETRIISFAPEPIDGSSFDEYGWSDEVFMHLPDMRSLLSFIHHGKGVGHQFVSATLVYADIAE